MNAETLEVGALVTYQGKIYYVSETNPAYHKVNIRPYRGSHPHGFSSVHVSRLQYAKFCPNCGGYKLTKYVIRREAIDLTVADASSRSLESEKLRAVRCMTCHQEWRGERGEEVLKQEMFYANEEIPEEGWEAAEEGPRSEGNDADGGS